MELVKGKQYRHRLTYSMGIFTGRIITDGYGKDHAEMQVPDVVGFRWWPVSVCDAVGESEGGN